MSQFIYGIHDENNLEYEGYIVLPRAIWHNQNDHSGENFSQWIEQGKTPIVRLNNGYFPDGTIPEQRFYDAFAIRCGNFVENSQGCHIWIIGNEPNHEIERPNGQVIHSEMYAECFSLCRDEILSRVDHSEDLVCVAAIAPWNVQTGDWLLYFEMVLRILENEVDAISLHTYTHGPQPDLIFSEQTMDAPFEDRRFHFRAYQDFMERIPLSLRDVGVYITETNQDVPWLDVNSGWVKNAYFEIDEWNREHNQQIRCLALYRWPRLDQWFIDGNDRVVDDFMDAVQFGYRWKEKEMSELVNPSYELPYNEQGAGEVKVANGWTAFFSEGETIEGQGPTARPEYKPLPKTIDEHRVIDGNTAQCWFTNWKIHDAGVYQRVTNIPAGATATFKANGQVWCSDSDDPRVSDGELYFRLGIDPTGGIDYRSGNVVWTDLVFGTKDYQEIQVSAIAQATSITVFVRSWNKWALKHNDMYVDKASLIIEGGGTIPPPDGGIQDALLVQIDNVQTELDKLSVMVEEMDKLAIQCVPLTLV
jgi:hypothetical protein